MAASFQPSRQRSQTSTRTVLVAAPVGTCQSALCTTQAGDGMKARRWQRLLLSLCLVGLIGSSLMMMDAAALQSRLAVHLVLGSSGSAGGSLQTRAGSLTDSDSSECSDANPSSCQPSRTDIVIRAEVRIIVTEPPARLQ